MADAPRPIDPRGPRTNQAVLASALVLGFLAGQTWVVPTFALVLGLGAAFGPRWGPILRLYQSVIRPRLAPPRHLEDPRPPRFAAGVGVAFLVAASVAFVAGNAVVGWSLALVVAALAALAAVTGLCVGCEMYVWFVRLRGEVRVVTVDRAIRGDEAAASAGRREAESATDAAVASTTDETWLVFTTEYCAVCPTVVEAIRAARPQAGVRVVDVAAEPALASRHRVRRAPTAVLLAADGAVQARLSGADAIRAELATSSSGPVVTTAVPTGG